MALVDDINKAIAIAAPFAQLIPGVGPYVGFAVRVVADVQATMEAKPGAEKKQKAMDDLADAVNIWNAANGANVNNSEMMKHMDMLIEGVVGLANDVGAFKHKGQP